jgi:hypothetical protein
MPDFEQCGGDLMSQLPDLFVLITCLADEIDQSILHTSQKEIVRDQGLYPPLLVIFFEIV